LLWVLGRYPIAPSRLLVLGGVGAVVRWTLFALSPPLPVLFVLQPLHALSFTATYVAAVQLIDQLVADRHGVFAQALYWGLTTGLCTGAGVAGAGFLYQRAGANGYWAMCALALVGLAVALRLNRRLVEPRAFEFQMDSFETDKKALSVDVRARRAARPASTPA
jgi:PPP family 3-phenylpropionic acid transporter